MSRPRVAVWKFASCDGCQLTLLDCEDELLAVAGAVELVHFAEASSRLLPGPYDLSFVEGSITTREDERRIREVRAQSRLLVTLGACAASGGVQALRNQRDHAAMMGAVYAHPEYLDSLATSTAIARHVPVDYELRGCPIDKRQLLEVVAAVLAGRKPQVRSHPVCVECKQRGTVCLTVAHAIPCMGPITHAGCGALCPSYGRGCFGCFGPSEGARPDVLLGGRVTPWIYR